MLGANTKEEQNQLTQSEFLLIAWLFQIDKPQVHDHQLCAWAHAHKKLICYINHPPTIDQLANVFEPLLTDCQPRYRPTHAWYLRNSSPIYHTRLISHRYFTDTQSRCVCSISTHSRSLYQPTTDRVSTNYRSSVGRHTNDISTAIAVKTSTVNMIQKLLRKSHRGSQFLPWCS